MVDLRHSPTQREPVLSRRYNLALRRVFTRLSERGKLDRGSA